MDGGRCYKDILAERRREGSTFMWISRELRPRVAYEQSTKPRPADHKTSALESPRVQELLKKLSVEQKVSRQVLEVKVKAILDEIGYSKHLTLIRWLGLFLTKICLRVCSGILVNEANILRVRSLMGAAPMIFLPSHRSYADFILMSFVLFTYDIEIPAIASGMDFHAMWGMGSMLRETGAFFMHRTYNGDDLYWTIFKEYVHQLVIGGDLPIEFFIEGTRSRSGKSLPPKLGLLSMVLRAFFNREIPDILFVPINISYDRVMEEKLFAYELLGVPKPKESTSAFFKSLSLIKENYGRIYFNFAEPISARTVFGSLETHRDFRPGHLRELGDEEKGAVAELAGKIVLVQQRHCVLTAFNLTAVAVTDFLINQASASMKIDELIDRVAWLRGIFEEFGATVDIVDVKSDLEEALRVHSNLVKSSEDGKSVAVIYNETFAADGNMAAKLKGYDLSRKTMSKAVPFVTLQIYVNATLHYIIDAAVVVVVLDNGGRLSREALYGEFGFLRLLLLHEFVHPVSAISSAFEKSLRHLEALEVIEIGEKITLNGGNRIRAMLSGLLDPFLYSYHSICRVLLRVSPSGRRREKQLLAAAQADLEAAVNDDKTFVHPYVLSLDTLGNCLSCLVEMGALKKNRSSGSAFYEIADRASLSEILVKIEIYLPKRYNTSQATQTPQVLRNKL